jgi:hypothetical protein
LIEGSGSFSILVFRQARVGLTSLFDRPDARYKMGCREKLPDPSIDYTEPLIWPAAFNIQPQVISKLLLKAILNATIHFVQGFRNRPY